MNYSTETQISIKIKTNAYQEIIDPSMRQTLEDLDNYYHSQKEINKRQGLY